jgi:hypothetical protein
LTVPVKAVEDVGRAARRLVDGGVKEDRSQTATRQRVETRAPEAAVDHLGETQYQPGSNADDSSKVSGFPVLLRHVAGRMLSRRGT